MSSEMNYGRDNVVLRSARTTDKAALRRLAGRDSDRVPDGPLLVAELGGELLAAHAPATGATIADPFRPTGHLVELLEAHASARRPVALKRGSRRAGAPRRISATA